ncbi:MAG TPA: hypothetical protein VLF89_05555, partial [Candidatus Saccharimonadales bacterium]|nr:hypothetical protein [Candidatus Saccharimonadales bacterium]
MSELPNPIEPYQKLPIINFTIHPERTPFQSGNEQDGEEFPWDFTFEYRTPSGKEFCVSYFREDFGKSKFDRSAWRLDHINKWIDPSISEEIPEDGLRVSLEEAEQEIGVEGYS